VYHPAVRALALAGFSGYASAAMPRRWCRMTSVGSSCADQRPTDMEIEVTDVRVE